MKIAHKELVIRGVLLMIIIATFTFIGVRNSPNSIHNPDNREFVLEVAFNKGIAIDEVTQKMFNERYLK